MRANSLGHTGAIYPPIIATNPPQCANETIDGKVGVAQEILQIYANLTTPDLNGPPGLQNDEVNPYALYACEPAPMGIADFGIGSSGPYDYSTTSSLGVIHFDSFLSTADTIQQNVVLNFTSNGNDYYYWVQNVAQLSPPEAYVVTGPCATVCPPQNGSSPTTVNEISYETNIWNFSGAPIQEMNPAAISGANGSVQQGDVYISGAGANESGNNLQIVYPTTVYLKVNTALNSLGQPVVTFLYNDGVGGWQTYDTVTFLTKATSTPGYVVDGSKYNPYGIFFDSELVFGGAGDGAFTADVASSVQMQLEFWNGHNYQLVENAYNFGSDTAEAIVNVEATAGDSLSNGSINSNIAGGPGVLGSLWNSSEIDVVTVKTGGLSSGTLAVAPSSSGSSAAAPSDYQFTGGSATVTLFPGTYLFKVYNSNGALTGQKTLTLFPGKSYSVNIR